MQSLHVDNICQAIPSELLYLFVSDFLQKKNVHQFDHVNRRRGNVKSYETEQFKFNKKLYFCRQAYTGNPTSVCNKCFALFTTKTLVIQDL